MEQPGPVVAPPGDETLTLKKRNQGLAWLAGILAVAVVVMGALMIVGYDAGQNLTAEQEQMLETVDEALVAWNAHDGEALAALYAANGYHDNGTARFYVADGRLADYVTGLGALGFSVVETDSYVIGNFVISGADIPGSGSVQISIHAMSADGATILWHLAP
ncbi:MAG: hypothetical protein OEO77_01630 [Acidimicrobiia bacterium]|nr:hypothetical protein [Acidimicrobiia bacterium]